MFRENGSLFRTARFRGQGRLTDMKAEIAIGQCSGQVVDQAKANLNQFAIIGLTARFEESLALMARTLGWTAVPDNKKINVTDSRPAIADIPKSTIEQIETYNQLDLELYEHALTCFEERLANPAKFRRLIVRPNSVDTPLSNQITTPWP